MTRRDEVIRMALECGMGQLINGQMCSDWRPEIERFSALVAAAERERCHSIVSAPHWKQAVRAELGKRSEAIRALGDEVGE